MKKGEEKKISELRALFPKSVTVSVSQSKDGGYVADILTYEGCRTEAESLSELIAMVNDAVRTYLEIPLEYVMYMPNYLPPVRVAQVFNVFPSPVTKQRITLKA